MGGLLEIPTQSGTWKRRSESEREGAASEGFEALCLEWQKQHPELVTRLNISLPPCPPVLLPRAVPGKKTFFDEEA